MCLGLADSFVRFAITNRWGIIDSIAVATRPLVLCDDQTVEPGDLGVFEIHCAGRAGQDRIGGALLVHICRSPVISLDSNATNGPT